MASPKGGVALLIQYCSYSMYAKNFADNLYNFSLADVMFSTHQMYLLTLEYRPARYMVFAVQPVLPIASYVIAVTLHHCLVLS